MNKKLLVAIVAATALVAFVWSPGASGTLPLPEELPGNVVVVVSHMPVSVGTVTRAEFRHALVQGAAAAGRSPAPKPGGRGYEKLKAGAIGELLDFIWIQGQAREMGIGVTRRQVSRELARLRKQAFKSKAQYNRFLKEAHYTRRDVKARVKLQILSSRIQERSVEGVTSESQRRKAFTRFVTEYAERWTARTVCAPEYVVARCSNRPLP